jgi:hypothetical protein
MDQIEFLNAYIQRMLALNSELTNKNVMIETRFMLLEKKYNELAEAYNATVQKQEPPVDTEALVEQPKQEEKITKSTKKDDDQF